MKNTISVNLNPAYAGNKKSSTIWEKMKLLAWTNPFCYKALVKDGWFRRNLGPSPTAARSTNALSGAAPLPGPSCPGYAELPPPYTHHLRFVSGY